MFWPLMLILFSLEYSPMSSIEDNDIALFEFKNILSEYVLSINLPELSIICGLLYEPKDSGC